MSLETCLRTGSQGCVYGTTGPEGVRQSASIWVKNLHMSLQYPKWKDRHLIENEVPSQKESLIPTLHTTYTGFSPGPFRHVLGRGREVCVAMVERSIS